MADGLPLGLDGLNHKVGQAAKILDGIILDQTLALVWSSRSGFVSVRSMKPIT